MTLVGNPPYPARRNDWPRLAAMAAQLLAQREERYPALVDAGRLDPHVADRGRRVMRAIAEQWRRVTTREPLSAPLDYGADLGASWAEMLADLASAATRAAQIAAKAPDDRQLREQADLTRALHWHQQPAVDGCEFPHIWQAHDLALYEHRALDQRGQAA